MKKLLVIAGLLFLGNAMRAQITLSGTSYPASLLGTDTLKETVHNSPFPSFAPMSGTLCDMTSLVDTSSLFSVYRVPSTSIYQFADSAEFVSNFSAYLYAGEIETNVNSSGIVQYGTRIMDTSYSLFPVTSGTFDSLIIPAQNSVYSTPHVKIAFPASLGSSWYSNWYSDLNFEISFAAYSLYHAPGIVHRYTTESNNVIGWGMMRVNDAVGIPSQYLDVLQVTIVTQTVDSYFLAGAPMPPIILAALSLTQGKTDTTYTQNFYREREVTPLASVVFRDAGFTQPYKATRHVQRLWPAGIDEPGARSLSVFPNPVDDRTLRVQLPQPGTVWQYELVSLSGAIVQSGTLTAATGGNTLEVTTTSEPGVYLLRLTECLERRVYSSQISITN